LTAGHEAGRRLPLAPMSLRPVPAPPPEPAPLPVRRRLGFFGSFSHAWDGLLTACAQRNMKVHVVSAVLVGLVGSGIRLELAEKVTLIFCVTLIFFAEILNTALEALVDLHTEDFRELAKTTKDAAAAAVLVLAIGTVVIFAAIVVTNWKIISLSGPQILRQVAFGLPYAGLTGLLLSEMRRPRWLDHTVFLLGAVLWAVLWQFSVSTVFTVLTGAMLFLAWRASARSRPDADDGSPES
jgi:diacylglycerol kinase (ATP)